MSDIRTKVFYITCHVILFLGLWLNDHVADGRVHQKIYRGSYNSGGGGVIKSPPTHPDQSNQNYKRDGDIYIFIIENTDIGGVIQLTFDEFYLHPKSWILLRDSKYGGYIGTVIDRYEDVKQPPAIITSTSCCLRIEFNIGCCGPAYPDSTGFVATFKYVYSPNKGRREDCSKEKIFTQFCNGECIPPLNDSCPPKIPEPQNVKSKFGKLYPLAVIIAILCAFLFLSIIILCVIICVEQYRKHRESRNTKDENPDSVLLSILARKVKKKESMPPLLQMDHEDAKECEKFIDRGLYYNRDDSYSTDSQPSTEQLSYGGSGGSSRKFHK